MEVGVWWKGWTGRGYRKFVWDCKCDKTEWLIR